MSIPVKVNIDGAGMRFDATVITDASPPGICLGTNELRSYNSNKKDPTGEARIDELASLVVFIILDAAALPLKRLIDTSSRFPILTFSAYNRLAEQTGAILWPLGVDLYAANGETTKTFGLVESRKFQLVPESSFG